MDPLDSTAILVRAVDSLMNLPPVSRADTRRATVRRVPAAEALPERQPAAEAASQADNPRTTIRKAEQLLQLVATGGFPTLLGRRVAVAAYLAELDARSELARLRREGPARSREWIA